MLKFVSWIFAGVSGGNSTAVGPWTRTGICRGAHSCMSEGMGTKGRSGNRYLWDARPFCSSIFNTGIPQIFAERVFPNPAEMRNARGSHQVWRWHSQWAWNDVKIVRLLKITKFRIFLHSVVQRRYRDAIFRCCTKDSFLFYFTRPDTEPGTYDFGQFSQTTGKLTLPARILVKFPKPRENWCSRHRFWS